MPANECVSERREVTRGVTYGRGCCAISRNAVTRGPRPWSHTGASAADASQDSCPRLGGSAARLASALEAGVEAALERAFVATAAIVAGAAVATVLASAVLACGVAAFVHAATLPV